MTLDMTMKAWLAELEMEMDPNNPSLIDEPYQKSETMEPTFEEQLAAILGSDFPYPIYTTNDDTASPEGAFDTIDQCISTLHTSENHNDNNNNNKNDSDNIVCSDARKRQPSKTKKETKKQAMSVGSKRKRQPGQVQDHIIAERKRRELLSHMMISLSAMIPGLKKIDKTSVLGAAIKHMKELQEKVKVLESVIAKRTVVVVNKSKLKADNDSSDDNVSSSTVNDCSGGCKDGDGDGDGNGNGNCSGSSDSIPEIEVKVMGKALLLRIFCEKQKGIFVKLFVEAQKHGLSITNFNVAPLSDIALDITIVAQMERGYDKYVRDLVKILRNAFHLTTDHSKSNKND
ncbi:transcription factor bHLH18-like [Chenopodium quinoa]|uniref:transcription factor bHLH18-like n=1 Tax=Chenopodium quinoa TaxID=63459 RepID=UPI000B79A590|nr:transcription factor bHLH18-like [Chenopodium quinoa]